MSPDRSNLSKIIVTSIVGALVAAVTYYCVVKIMHTNEGGTQITYERPLSESDKIWGATPNSACQALERAYLIPNQYSLIVGTKDSYSCSTAEVGIDGPESKKTMQYSVSGFGDKATNLKLVMKLDGDQNSPDAIAARKAWAIYSALLAESVFSQVMSEDEMQKMAHLSHDQSFAKVYNKQFLAKANAIKGESVSIYTYEIQGLPVISVN
ncbi:hypothetical protein HLH17_14505 [Acinetobacter sp. ANC 5380]|uniref:Uncharacterized protein n=1 Tax=Acinetobacter terrae TaxID=2731247 RepID=A0A7Y2RHI1_9GAMM|nr:hypothetical protein [Acinetobacter terrae]NNH78833.1 hypothetical protein [Acinetobacter terrae]